MENKNSEAIIILCSQLCVGENIKPFTPSEWSKFAAKLMTKNLTPSDVINMNFNELKQNFSEEAERLNNLISRSASLSFEIKDLSERGIEIVTRADKNYPRILKNKFGKNCPPLFYYSGNLELCNKKMIGIVGSRSIKEKEEKFTQELVKKLIQSGYSIVSGGAKGVDSISTETALSLGASAMEYVSDSMIKKIKKREVITAIRDGRLLIMSFSKPSASFSVAMAMARNKYIYAQSLATVVIKSDYGKGGTWSGASEALKKGYCKVFCRKDKEVKGNIGIIEKGAIPIDENWDCSYLETLEEIVSIEKEKEEKNINIQLNLFKK